MAEITPNRWRQIRSIFDIAIAQDAAGRDRLLAESCAGDPDLRREVESLLAVHEKDDSFLGQPVFRVHQDPIRDQGPEATEAVGRYRTVRRIGQGGMGVVYLAERADQAFERRVAVKILKPGMDSQEVMQRFRSERQILAGLEHPNICQLLDGGNTDAGRPYLVMEYVEGRPIDLYCADLELSIDRRLRLFQKVCRAVHFAHQRLIVHRDLKPSNVLVTAAGEPKLLDFGIAKLLDPVEFPQTVLPTQPGSGPMTPRYASPEQVAGHQITTASDVYSLGVVLYELLTGAVPYRTESVLPEEARRAILSERPEKPSEAVASVEPAHADAAHRLRRQLSGDLDNIVLTALRKDPARRYASAEQFADDIERHLGGLPVRARPDTFSYRAGKFLRRHRTAAAVAAGALALLIGFTLTLLFQRQAIVEQRDRAETVSSYLAELFENADPVQARGRTVTAQELLDRGAKRIESELRGNPAAFGELAATMGRSYKGLGDYGEAERLLGVALDAARERHGEDHGSVAAILHQLAEVETYRGDYDAAERLGLEALAICRRLEGSDDPATAEILSRLGRVAELTARYGEAKRYYNEALTIARAVSGHELEAEILDSFGLLHTVLGNDREAEGLLRQALEIQRQLGGEDHPSVARTLNDLGLLQRRTDPAAGEETLRLALTRQRALYDRPHPDLVITLNNLGFLLRELGRLGEAEQALDEALTMIDSLYDGASSVHSSALDQLAAVRYDQGRYEEAKALRLRSLAMIEELVGRDHPSTAQHLSNLARDLVALNRREEAELLFREALDISRRYLGGRHESVAVIENNLGDLAYRRGDLETARDLYAGAITTLRTALGEGHPKVAIGLYNLANLESDTGEHESAEARYREAIEIATAALGTDHLNVAFARTGLAWLLSSNDRPEEALELARGALATFEAQLPAESIWRASALRAIGEALLRTGRLTEAEPPLVKAHALYLELRGAEGRQTKETRELLLVLQRAGNRATGSKGANC